MARGLIDPNMAALRRPPRDDRDLMIAAHNGWIVALDNLSGLAPALSDALCTLATGGGFATRELYTDGEEKLFDATRPIMLNGIEDVATRPDLLDRIALPDAARPFPRATGTTRMSYGRRSRPSGRASWGRSWTRFPPPCETCPLPGCTGKPRHGRLRACGSRRRNRPCRGNRARSSAPTPATGATANELALEASIIAGPLAALLSAQGGRWEGTARELLDALEAAHTDEKTRKRKEWPTGPRKLSGELRRLAAEPATGGHGT